MNKDQIKKVLDENIFNHNPFDESIKERMITKVYDNNQKQTSKKRHRIVFHSLLTLCAGLAIVIGGVLFLGNSKISNNLGESKTDKQVVEETNEENKDKTLLIAEELLTNPDALEAFKLIPKETQHNFDEMLLSSYNTDPDYREKVKIGIDKAKYLSKYKLEDLSYKMVKNDFVAEFNDQGDKVYVVGENWEIIEEEFQTLGNSTQKQFLEVLNNIGREFVIGNGEVDTPNNQGVFKTNGNWNVVPDVVKERIPSDIENKINGIEVLLGSLHEDNDTLIYDSLKNYENSYKNVIDKGITMESFIEYQGVNFRFFIFSYLILEPRPVEVFAEPKYRSNEEQVEIVLSGPR